MKLASTFYINFCSAHSTLVSNGDHTVRAHAASLAAAGTVSFQVKTMASARPIAASNADELQKAAKRVAGLQWEVVWEAPEEAEGDFALPDLD